MRSDEKRLAAIEEALKSEEDPAPPAPEDILIRIEFAETLVLDGGERTGIRLPAEYDEPHFSVPPDSMNRRYCVQFPINEHSEKPISDS